MEKTFAVAKEVKIGKYILIDDVPCRVVNIESSAPGKHGAAKMRITGIGVFGGQKKTLLKPSDGDVEIPLIERKSGQVMSVNGNMAQLMDSATYEMFELEIPTELAADVQPGKEIEYMEAMGKRAMQRVK
jgi:translation initiation factor 5A